MWLIFICAVEHGEICLNNVLILHLTTQLSHIWCANREVKILHLHVRIKKPAICFAKIRRSTDIDVCRFRDRRTKVRTKQASLARGFASPPFFRIDACTRRSPFSHSRLCYPASRTLYNEGQTSDFSSFSSLSRARHEEIKIKNSRVNKNKKRSSKGKRVLLCAKFFRLIRR